MLYDTKQSSLLLLSQHGSMAPTLTLARLASPRFSRFVSTYYVLLLWSSSEYFLFLTTHVSFHSNFLLHFFALNYSFRMAASPRLILSRLKNASHFIRCTTSSSCCSHHHILHAMSLLIMSLLHASLFFSFFLSLCSLCRCCSVKRVKRCGAA